jgi:hypothetical protein
MRHAQTAIIIWTGGRDFPVSASLIAATGRKWKAAPWAAIRRLADFIRHQSAVHRLAGIGAGDGGGEFEDAS